MRGAIPAFHQYAFMAWCLVKKKHRDNFTFYRIRIHGVILITLRLLYLYFTVFTHSLNVYVGRAMHLMGK
jgi:hypothetical protein